MISFTHVLSLTNIVKTIQASEANYEGFIPPCLSYRAKIKLHGTNAGVRFDANGITAQSRTSDLGNGQDNCGFAAWVKLNNAYFKQLREALAASILNYGSVTIFGEWCGQGIQAGTAINQLDRKIFAVFTVQYGESGPASRWMIQPNHIRMLVTYHEDVFILPWLDHIFTLDFKDLDQVRAEAEKLNDLVAQVEALDPWVKSTFGFDGIGEGVVLYPIISDLPTVERKLIADYMFKAKGEKHAVQRTKVPVQVDPEVVTNVEAFVAMFVTQARLEQGLTEACGNDVCLTNTGVFLKWLTQDILRESVVELEASGLEWKQVVKPVSQCARNWFIQRAQEI